MGTFLRYKPVDELRYWHLIPEANKSGDRQGKLMTLERQGRGRPGSMANLGVSHVGLRVGNLPISVRFYRNILGLKSRTSERGVARIPSGGDLLVLHEKGYGISDFHFGFRVDSRSKVDKWRAWLRSRNIRIYQDVTEEKYRSIKIRDPDGYWIEITYEGREIAPRRSKSL
jgi:catechol 2,3-dioxygenase-like lactoylglutathione lyase family enzyme